MTNILMVCLGNICRSPLAEGILKSKLPVTKFFVDSAGTANYHVGEPPDGRSIAIAKTHDIDITHQRGRQFEVSDFDQFDHIYVMDTSNYQNVINMARDTQDIGKVKHILDAHPENNSMNVPDPYYGGTQGFEMVFQLLDTACDTIARNLLS